MPTIARLHKLGIDAFREKTFYLLHLLRKPPEDVGVDHRHASKGCLRDDEKTIVCTGCPARTFGWFALFTMRNSGVFPPRIDWDPRLETEDFLQTDERRHNQEVVEPDGIEPTTSCLQSRRSPN